MTNDYLKNLKTTDWWGKSCLPYYFSPCPFLPTAELLIVWSSSSSVAELFSAKVAMNFFSSSYKQELIIAGCQMDLSLRELRYLRPSMTLASTRTNAHKSRWNHKEAWEVDLTSHTRLATSRSHEFLSEWSELSDEGRFWKSSHIPAPSDLAFPHQE